MKKIVISHSPRETENIAVKLARTLKGGEVIALEGELGAGKTVFVKGLARALGIKHRIQSPTFVVMKTYPVKKKEIATLVHVDCYRLHDGGDLNAIGLMDYFADPHAVVVIEWADKVREILPPHTQRIQLSHRSEGTRQLIF